MQLQRNPATKAGINVCAKDMIEALSTATAFQAKNSLKVIWNIYLFIRSTENNFYWHELMWLLQDVDLLPNPEAINRWSFDQDLIAKQHIVRCWV